MASELPDADGDIARLGTSPQSIALFGEESGHFWPEGYQRRETGYRRETRSLHSSDLEAGSDQRIGSARVVD